METAVLNYLLQHGGEIAQLLLVLAILWRVDVRVTENAHISNQLSRSIHELAECLHEFKRDLDHIKLEQVRVATKMDFHDEYIKLKKDLQ